MRALIVFDKFKDAIGAPEAGAIAARAIAAKHPAWQLDPCPLTDGGEGFCAILTRAAGGETESVTVTGPRGAPVRASLGLVALENIPPAARTLLAPGPGERVAVIEMASASGLALLAPGDRDPWQATTLGTGELIRAAAARGVAAILVGVGGSATNDLGLGALTALGLECQDAHGRPILPPVPARWGDVARLAGTAAVPPPIRIACDVTNPLLGPRGAAAIYGPQKGLRAADLARLEHAADQLARMLLAHCGQPPSLLEIPGAGAAGGISFGLMAAAGARLLPGFDLVTVWLGLEARLAAADLVVTGEGRFDDSSLTGKGPGAIAARALALGKRVHVFAGAVTTTAPAPAGLTLHAITPPGTPLPEALRATAQNLAAAVQRAF
jgi:glycerate kinase